MTACSVVSFFILVINQESIVALFFVVICALLFSIGGITVAVVHKINQPSIINNFKYKLSNIDGVKLEVN